VSDFDAMLPAPWEALEAAMDRKERQRKSFIWYSIAAGVLVVLMGSVFAYLNHKPAHVANSQPAKSGESQHTQNTTSANQSAVSGNATSENAVVDNSVSGDAPLTESNTNNSNLSEAASALNTNPVQKIANSSPAQKTALKTSPVSPNNNPIAIKVSSPVAPILESTLPMLVSADLKSQEILSKGLLYMVVEPMVLGEELVAENQLISAAKSPVFEGAKQDPNKVLGSWLMEISADQNQTGLTYSPNQNWGDYVHKNYFKHMKEGEFALNGARVHVAIMKQITPHSYVKAGIAWAQNRTAQHFNFMDSMPAVVSANQQADVYGNYPIFGYLSPGPKVQFDGKTQYQWISLPVGWVGNYTIGKNWAISPEIVIQPNKISLTTNSKTLDYQTLQLKDLNANDYRSWVWGARLAVGLEKRLNYANAVGLRMNTQGLVQSMNLKNSPVQSRGWNMGLSVYYVVRID